ncbi:MAG: phosphatase PAP2 family protein [Spirochaetia bacterium]|jgi:undecaprenyl-diphosphatase
MKLARSAHLRAALLVLLALGPVFSAPAQLSVSLIPDGVSAAGGALLAAASLGLHGSTQEMPVDMDRVSRFDRLAMFSYSPGLDVASSVAQYAAAALPLALAFGISQDQAFAAGVIYFEVLSRSFFAKNTLKFLFPRVRPWVYLAPVSGSVPEVWEGNDSFPSGHATLAFAAAAFGVTVAAVDLPSGSPWLLPFAATEVSLAVLTASLRVFSGMHFMTDVIAGAALGTVIGVALPLTHTAWTGGSIGKSIPALRFEVPILALAL